MANGSYDPFSSAAKNKEAGKFNDAELNFQLEGLYEAEIRYNLKESKWEIFTIGGGFTVGIIYRFKLPICIGVLHKQGEIRHAAFRGLDGGKESVGRVGGSGSPFLQFLIATYTMLGEEIHGLCRLL